MSDPPREFPDHRCPECGSTLLTNGKHMWCSFDGDPIRPACRYGIRELVPVPSDLEAEIARLKADLAEAVGIIRGLADSCPRCGGTGYVGFAGGRKCTVCFAARAAIRKACGIKEEPTP